MLQTECLCPLKIHTLKANLKCAGIWMWVLWEVNESCGLLSQVQLNMGINVHIKEIPENALVPFTR